MFYIQDLFVIGSSLVMTLCYYTELLRSLILIAMVEIEPRTFSILDQYTNHLTAGEY